MILLSSCHVLGDVFARLLAFTRDGQRVGACHDTAAILYIMLCELGYPARLLLGQVLAAQQRCYFDHSWVEINGAIYDIAIAFPLPGAVRVSGSIFASRDLETSLPTPLTFGFSGGAGLQPIAEGVAARSLAQYDAEHHAGIWQHAARLLAPVTVTRATALRSQYGDVMRTVV